MINVTGENLFLLFALSLDILAMRTFISLNVLETTLAIPYGIELRPGYTAVRCTTGQEFFEKKMGTKVDWDDDDGTGGED